MQNPSVLEKPITSDALRASAHPTALIIIGKIINERSINQIVNVPKDDYLLINVTSPFFLGIYFIVFAMSKGHMSLMW